MMIASTASRSTSVNPFGLLAERMMRLPDVLLRFMAIRMRRGGLDVKRDGDERDAGEKLKWYHYRRGCQADGDDGR